MHIATNEPQPGRLQVVLYFDKDQRAHLGSDRVTVAYRPGRFILRSDPNGYSLRSFGAHWRIRVAPSAIAGLPQVRKINKTEVLHQCHSDGSIEAEAPTGLFIDADDVKITEAFGVLRAAYLSRRVDVDWNSTNPMLTFITEPMG